MNIDETPPNISVKSLIRSQGLGAYTAYLGNVKVLPFKVIQKVHQGYKLTRLHSLMHPSAFCYCSHQEIVRPQAFATSSLQPRIRWLRVRHLESSLVRTQRIEIDNSVFDLDRDRIRCLRTVDGDASVMASSRGRRATREGIVHCFLSRSTKVEGE